MDALSLEFTNELVKIAAEKSTADFGRPICIAVCDGSGFLLAFARMEGAPLRSIAISQGKAYTAARMGVNTDAFLERMHRENIDPRYFCDEKFTALPGGSVLKNSSNVVIGSVGISGLTSSEDQIIANHLADLVARVPS